MRSFVKRSRIANYTKKIKQLLDKTNENVQFVLANRRKVNDFGVRDLEKIRVWESALRQKGPPLSKFFESWSKAKEKETQKVMSDQVNVNDYDFIPKINKDKKTKVKKEFKGIFDEDGDSDEVSTHSIRGFVTSRFKLLKPKLFSTIFCCFQDDVERFELKEERNKKRKVTNDETSKEDTDDVPKIKKSKKSKQDKSKPIVEEDDDEDDEVKEFDIDDFSNVNDKDNEDDSLDSASIASNSEDSDSGADEADLEELEESSNDDDSDSDAGSN